MRYLTWHQPGPLALDANLTGGDSKKVYVLDDNYIVKRAWIRLGGAPSGTGTLDIDIRADGVSIFSLAPSLLAETTYEEETEAFADVNLADGVEISWHVTGLPSGEPGHDATIGLDLEEA